MAVEIAVGEIMDRRLQMGAARLLLDAGAPVDQPKGGDIPTDDCRILAFLAPQRKHEQVRERSPPCGWSPRP